MNKLNKSRLKAFADALDGRNYQFEIDNEIEENAKKLGVVIVYGYSDYSTELVGAINDSVNSTGGGVIQKYPYINSYFGKDGIAWQYTTKLEHEKFNIMFGKKIFCKGIVLMKPNYII